MRDSLLQRRVLLKLGGAGVVGGIMTTSPVSGEETDSDSDDTTGNINSLSGFETPLPITDSSHRLQLISPTNRLTIDAETDDIIDLVFEWDDSISIGGSSRSISGSGILNDEEDIGEHRAIFRGEASDSNAIVYDRLTLRGLDTSDVEPGDEVEITVSARQADSTEDIGDFDDVVATVDDGDFNAEATTEATFEVTQGTLISTNDEATTSLELAESVDHTIGFDIDQLRDEDEEGTPAGPAKGIIINYFIDDDDGLEFDLADDDVTLGGAATDLDLEVVKEREIPGIGQVLLEIANEETLEDDADLEVGDTVTVELSGLDTAAIDPNEFDDSSSTVEVGLHGAATFDPIVEESIVPDRGAYTIDAVNFEFGDQNGPTEIEDWHDLDNIRSDLGEDYVLVADLDEDTAGYDDIASETANDSSGFEPIGDSETPFSGTFSGDGHTIEALNIDRPEEEGVGLFGDTENAEFSDIVLADVRISGDFAVGGLCGFHFASKTFNVAVDGEVSGQTRVGGLVGQNVPSEGEVENGAASEVDNSQFAGSVNGDFSVGGLIGDNRGTVVGSEALASVTGENDVGGVFGRQGGTVGSLKQSFAEATVTVTGSGDEEARAGGLIGSQANQTTLINSFADSSIEATGDNSEIGGLVGVLGSDSEISQSYAIGSIEAEDASSLGGLVGESNGEIEESYAAVEVQGTSEDVGGFIGELEGSSPTNSYWDTEVSGQEDSSGAEGLSTNEMTGDSVVANMDGLDFDDVWESQVDPDDYPTLQAIGDDETDDNFEVTIVEPTDGSEVREDQTLEITAEIDNTGSEPGVQDIVLTEPIELTETDVELASEDVTKIEFSVPESDVEGSFDITVESDDTSDSVSVTAVDPCFIATAAYNTPQADEIDVLRDFRDSVLKKHAVGRVITKAYYTTSPPVASWIRQTQQRRQVVRKYFVEPLVRTVDRLTDRSD